MRCYVLCGGKGTRLGEPVKCLTEVAGRPFIEHKLEQLRFQGATDLRLVVGPYAYEYSYLGLPMIEDPQTGIRGCLDLIPENTHWAFGDTLLTEPFALTRQAQQKVMTVVEHDGGNIAGIYLDCGIYTGKRDFRVAVVPGRTYTLNTPEDLAETRAYLEDMG